MDYHNVKEGIFLSRPNRFIAHCLIEGKKEICHVKNTGRCKELLLPGRKVYLEYHDTEARKTKYDLISVEKGDRLINMDSQVPNKVFREGVLTNKFLLPFLEGPITDLKGEVSFQNSRFDFWVKTQTEEGFIEVKGVTLEENNVVFFPDAPTERGVKHVKELIKAKEEGYAACIVFIVQMSDVDYFMPNYETHPAFGEALKEAAKKGVMLLAFDTVIVKDGIFPGKSVPICL